MNCTIAFSNRRLGLATRNFPALRAVDADAYVQHAASLGPELTSRLAAA